MRSIIILVTLLHFALLSTHSQNSSFYPYYKVNHVIRNNGLLLADGVVAEEKQKWDAMNNKIETLFYLESVDDSTWQWIKPTGITVNTNGDTLKYEAFPRNIVAFKNYFISIIDVGENPDRMQVIHYSRDGILWISTGIYVTSIHVINDKIIAEHNLSLAVSEDGIHWKLYAYFNWDNSYPEYTNQVPAENQTIYVFSFPDTAINFNKEEYPYISYDWFSLKGYYRDSVYILTDTTSFMAVSDDAIRWNYIETPTKADSNLNLQYAHGKVIYLAAAKDSYYLYESTDFRNWTRTKIETDSSDFENGFYIEDAFVLDTLLYLQVSTFYGDEENGLHEYSVTLCSEDSKHFRPCDATSIALAGAIDAPAASIMEYNSKSMNKIHFIFKELRNGRLVGLDSENDNP
ncbi:MAG TPA: hypothetical protein VK179_14055 [Bacteroidales bacterium]|nr:hypothetical protein [Bacteroidales bacterium]